MSDPRTRLVDKIANEIAATADELGLSGLDPRVEAALRAIPREAFVPEDARALAYIDNPLPIGRGQTISQPFIVALMTQLLEVGPGDRVFELGTGSGYQAAILAAMGVAVYSMEIVPELAQRAASTLEQLDTERVQIRTGDGWLGWPEAAPFSASIVTAAAPRIPQPLIDQLVPGGRLVIPVGDPGRIQQLAIFIKEPNGTLSRRDLLRVRFVPITGPMQDRPSRSLPEE